MGPTRRRRRRRRQPAIRRRFAEGGNRAMLEELEADCAAMGCTRPARALSSSIELALATSIAPARQPPHMRSPRRQYQPRPRNTMKAAGHAMPAYVT